jgi:hypothetical protein
MKRVCSFLILLVLAGSPSFAAAQADEAPAVLALDDARVGQLRYLNLLLDRTEAALLPSAGDCLEETVGEAEACLRARGQAPELVFILDDAGDADPDRPGWRGLSASDPARRRAIGSASRSRSGRGRMGCTARRPSSPTATGCGPASRRRGRRGRADDDGGHRQG